MIFSTIHKRFAVSSKNTSHVSFFISSEFIIDGRLSDGVAIVVHISSQRKCRRRRTRRELLPFVLIRFINWFVCFFCFGVDRDEADQAIEMVYNGEAIGVSRRGRRGLLGMGEEVVRERWRRRQGGGGEGALLGDGRSRRRSFHGCWLWRSEPKKNTEKAEKKENLEAGGDCECGDRTWRRRSSANRRCREVNLHTFVLVFHVYIRTYGHIYEST